jgi:hypothetical protein
MTRQEQFKAELFDLLRHYKVEMTVEEERGQYDTVATGINFYSFTQYDGEGSVVSEIIDLTVGKWCDGGARADAQKQGD